MSVHLDDVMPHQAHAKAVSFEGVMQLGETVNEVAAEASILLAFQALGYGRPTRDQQEAIRAFVSGRDILS